MENLKKSNGIMKLWIARDEDRTLCVYNNKPTLSKEVNGLWVCDKFTTVNTLSSDYFPDVTFENSPQEVELNLVNVSDDSVD